MLISSPTLPLNLTTPIFLKASTKLSLFNLEYCKIYISVYYFKLFYIFELQTRLVYKSCSNILILQINYSAKGKNLNKI